MHIIVSTSYDTVEAYEATVEIAQTILSRQRIHADVVDFAANRPEHYTTYEIITKLVQKLLTSYEGEIVFNSNLGVQRNIVATQEAKQELVMYCFDKHVDPSDVTVHEVKSRFNIKDLQCLSRFHDIPVVDAWVAERAGEYSTIINNNWKVTATDIDKVKYLVDFVDEFAHTDEQYHVIEVTTPR